MIDLPLVVVYNSAQEDANLKPRTITVVEVRCQRCGYGWFPKVKKPRKCPSCQHMKWETKK